LDELVQGRNSAHGKTVASLRNTASIKQAPLRKMLVNGIDKHLSIVASSEVGFSGVGFSAARGLDAWMLPVLPSVVWSTGRRWLVPPAVAWWAGEGQVTNLNKLPE